MGFGTGVLVGILDFRVRESNNFRVLVHLSDDSCVRFMVGIARWEDVIYCIYSPLDRRSIDSSTI